MKTINPSIGGRLAGSGLPMRRMCSKCREPSNRTAGAASGERHVFGVELPDVYEDARGCGVIEFPLRLGRGGNDRKHWRAAARAKTAEKEATAWAIARAKPTHPQLPCVVTLTRIAPSNGLDDDNLTGSLKYVRDEVAAWLEVDDRRSDLVRYEYRQERGAWAARVQFRSAA